MIHGTESGKPERPGPGARSGLMLDFLGSLLWPAVIVVTTVSVDVAIGVFMATRKLD